MRIAPHVWEEMLRHCTEQLPMEACGLLSGKNGRVETIWKMENIDRSPVSFSMDERQVREVFRLMEQRGEELSGIYHSHPTAPALPSPHDIQFASYPDAVYVIVSLANGKPMAGCFHIRQKRVVPVPFVVEPPCHPAPAQSV